jgi:hypothetical protein
VPLHKTSADVEIRLEPPRLEPLGPEQETETVELLAALLAAAARRRRLARSRLGRAA